MAKGRRASTRRRKRDRNFVAINFNASIDPQGLGNNAGALTSIIGNLAEDLHVVSVDATWSLISAVVNEGPLQVGFSHSDLTIAEVIECLDVEMTDPDNRIDAERAGRPVRKVGMLREVGTAVEGVQLNHGEPIRTKFRFSVGNGHTIKAWTVNRGGATISSVGQIIEVDGTIYGRWRR